MIGSSNPTARLALRPTRAAALEVDVTAVTNSSSQPIAVELTLEVDDGVRLQRFDVGHAALFPPDQPARFVLPLPAMAATALGAPAKTAVLTAHVVPVRGEETLATDLSLTVSAALLTAPP